MVPKGHKDELYTELGNIDEQIKQLEKKRKVKLDKLVRLYSRSLKQNTHSYSYDDEIVVLSREVDKDLIEHQQLKARVKRIIQELEPDALEISGSAGQKEDAC